MPGARRSAPRSRHRAIAALVAVGLCIVAGSASSASAAVGEFQTRASSPVPVTSVAVDPATNVIYAQENEGTKFFSYDPATDAWSELAAAPINSENNGGATYLNGKIYTAYTKNGTTLGVYDIETNTWSEIANPLGAGTADITSAGGLIYMAAQTHFISYDPETAATATLANPPHVGSGGQVGMHQRLRSVGRPATLRREDLRPPGKRLRRLRRLRHHLRQLDRTALATRPQRIESR
jgi:hypothetical protein